MIVAKTGVGTTYALRVNAAGAVCAYFDNGSFEGLLTVCSAPLNIRQWYMATAVWESPLSLLSIYLNGQLVTSQTIATFSPDARPGNPLTIGSDQPGSGLGYFTGAIDDVRVYSRVLAGNEIQQIYATNPTSLGPNSSATCTVTLDPACARGRRHRHPDQHEFDPHRPGIGNGSRGRRFGELQRHHRGHRRQSAREPHRRLQQQLGKFGHQPGGALADFPLGMQSRQPRAERFERLHPHPDPSSTCRRHCHPDRAATRPSSSRHRSRSPQPRLWRRLASAPRSSAAMRAWRLHQPPTTVSACQCGASAWWLRDWSSLAGTPTSLGPNASGSCTVALTQRVAFADGYHRRSGQHQPDPYRPGIGLRRRGRNFRTASTVTTAALVSNQSATITAT